ncbi:MAG: tRNA lysidine(34) synthetase TilS [Kiritimatiellae bacterium]|nr:tRNA lysidine(34) synthetase TilS [Kiritimatiellia bacterium]
MRRAPSIAHRIAEFERESARWAPPGSLWIAGVSGGADSMTLLALAASAARSGGWTLRVAHVHHGLRGTEADGDAEFVRRACARLGVPCAVARADVRSRARAGGESVEMAAREARRDIFRREIEHTGAAGVLLAHTRDDQAETLLLRLARGAGPGGLRGMSSDARVGGIRIVRPLLDWPRTDIERFLRARHRRWREDRTNRDTKYLRNRVRHHLLPDMARALNPSLVETLARNAALWDDDEDWIQTVVDRAYRRLQSAARTLDIRAMRQRPAGLRRRVLRRWLMERGYPAARLDASVVEQADRVARGDSRCEALPAGWRIEPCGRPPRLTVFPPESKKITAPMNIRVTAPGSAVAADGGWRIEIEPAREFRKIPERGIGRWPAVAWMDATRALGREFVLRPWRAGDRYRPLGLRGTAKVQDILTNARVRGLDRKDALVLECDGEIVWMPGHRIAHDWAVSSARAPSFRIHIHRGD